MNATHLAKAALNTYYDWTTLKPLGIDYLTHY